MSEPFDVVVLGAGPAGANAALETARAGLKTLIVEEQHKAGGQVWRAKSSAIIKAPPTPESKAGDTLRSLLENSSMSAWYTSRGWQLTASQNAEWRLDVVTPHGPRVALTPSLILATGAQERVIPVKGWTLPGVIGLAAATALIKQEVMLPGDRTIVAGSGPLVFFVAAEIMRLGGRPAAVVTLNSRQDWVRQLPNLMSRSDLLAQGVSWIVKLQAAGVPIFWRHGIKSIDGEDQVACAVLRPVDRQWRLRKDAPESVVSADSVAIGHGLMPAVEASRLAGASHRFAPELGGWVPETDHAGKASVANLWICGDATGIFGAAAAEQQGKLTGLSVAAQRNGQATTPEQKALTAALMKARKFGAAAGSLMEMRPGLVENMSSETIVCRCEAISRDDLEQEIRSGATSPNAIKSGTRAGMGPCGGRFCRDTVARLISLNTGQTMEEVGLPTARSPLRPVAICDLASPIDYEALPIPGLAPL